KSELKMEEFQSQISTYLKDKPREYDDDLVRQIVYAIKVVDSDFVQIFMENGVQLTQEIEARVRKLGVG
ncbi:MAG: hypothetical protein R3Y07_09445, partial [Eubacteriales bacterium]